jgi:filamentous hemagglutinin family protein
VIDWQGFDVGQSHSVHFDQPNARSATLNRVRSGGASRIAGRITAPGTVIIQNNAGVLFTETARIDTGGLVATSQSVDAGRFQRSGRLRIEGGEHRDARVENRGEITVGEAGLAALVGGNVANDGVILARSGTVALASGRRTTIDLSGDGLVRIAVRGEAETETRGVSNGGMIDVGGGRVLLSAGAAAGAVDAAINTSGVIRAASASGAGGRVELVGRSSGAVTVAGRIEAGGATSGGAVTITGERVAIASSARIGADGGFDGGSVRIGGDLRGSGPLPRADHLTVAAGAEISASGAEGRGGRIIAWADDTTFFDGRIVATGAVAGGFVETSGAGALGVGANAAVTVGRGGEWLLDPRDVVITMPGGHSPAGPGTVVPPAGSTPFTIDAGALLAALASGDVTVTTSQAASTMAGDITVAHPLSWTGDGTLSLFAHRDVLIDRPVTAGGAGGFVAMAGRDVWVGSPLKTTGSGAIALDAGRDVRVNQNVASTGTGLLAFAATRDIVVAGQLSSVAGDITATAGRDVKVNANVQATGEASVSLTAQAGNVVITERPAGNLVVSTENGALDLTSVEGSVRLTRVNPLAASNIQVFSASGPVNVSAGDQILLQGGTQGGRWVRLGRTDSSSDLTLTARRIEIAGGPAGNTFAEVVTGAGGSITMLADELWVRSLFGGSPASISALGGADLTLHAAEQVWLGLVRAGTGNADGGNVVLSGDIVASVEPVFALAPGADFTFAPTTPGGSPSGYYSRGPLRVTTRGSGAVALDAPVTVSQATFVSEEAVRLGPTARITGNAPGDAVVVAAGRQFLNEAGSDVFGVTDPDARWLLFIDRFDGLVRELDGVALLPPGPRGFDLYGRTYSPEQVAALAAFDGNRIVYGEQPVLTITGDSATKPFGTAITPGYTFDGLRDLDTLETALSAGPTATSDGAPAEALPGDYATTVAATASEQGYIVQLVDGLLVVLPPNGGGGGGGGGGALLAPDYGGERFQFARGVPPHTPGDATFRTTVAEAPPAIDSTFALTYSLGQIGQSVPGGGGFTPAGGFIPASGGTETTGGCGGPINTGAAAGTCAVEVFAESFWTTFEEGIE